MLQSGFRSVARENATSETRASQRTARHAHYCAAPGFPQVIGQKFCSAIAVGRDKDATSRDCELKSEDSALAGLEIEHDSRVRNTGRRPWGRIYVSG